MGNTSSGQMMGAVAGGLIGGIVFPGLGILPGAAIGFSLGGIVDPPATEVDTKKRPRPDDIDGPTFRHNVALPIVYGQYTVTGNVIFIGKADTHWVKTAEQEVAAGGKDGSTSSQDVKTRWYDLDFAIGWAEGPIKSVDFVFKNQKDITDKEGDRFTSYLGTETQTVPQQVVDAILEFGDVPWRHTAYIMWHGTIGSMNALPLIEAYITGLDTVVEDTSVNTIIL